MINLDKPIEIGIPLNPFGKNPSCFHAGQPKAEPMNFQGFICSIEKGAPVNFYSTTIVPHGQGTHTECVGHISRSFQKVNEILPNPFMLAELITIKPESLEEDHVITKAQIDEHVNNKLATALIIRTLPNSDEKRTIDYSNTNPPYLTTQAIEFIVKQNYSHLLLDLPSVDKEKDDGAVQNHKIFWDVDGKINENRTITELIYVPDEVENGLYILNLQLSNVVLDAVPSRPILYAVLQN